MYWEKMNNSNKKLLIFGSSGFIAQSLIKLLDQKNCEYIALGKKKLDLTNNEQCKKILTKIQLKNVTVIFLSALRPSCGEELDINIKNLVMIKNLVSNINVNIIRQFIYISSDAVYPDIKNSITETTIISPKSLYGYMHSMREKYISNIIPKKKLTIFRPCAIYGKNETTYSYGINQFVRDAIDKNKIYLFGKGEEERDHILVDDFVGIIFESFQNKITGLFNVATGDGKSFTEIVNYINNAFNKSIQIIYKARKQNITHRSFDVTNLHNNFQKSKIHKIEEGVSKMIGNME